MARPLTRRKKSNGALYERPPNVEAEIDRALTHDFSEAVRRARISDSGSPEFLRPETLVHLIREAKRGGHDRESFALLELLLERCRVNLRGTIRNDGIREAEDLRGDILQSFALMFAEDAVEAGTELDFFECRFNSAFATLRIDLYNHEVARENKSVPDISEDGEESSEDRQGQDASSSDFWRSSRIENRIFLRQVAELLATMPAEQRQAVVMCRIWGVTQEEAARRAGVDVRTIRYRLKRADKHLSSIKETV